MESNMVGSRSQKKHMVHTYFRRVKSKRHPKGLWKRMDVNFPTMRKWWKKGHSSLSPRAFPGLREDWRPDHLVGHHYIQQSLH